MNLSSLFYEMIFLSTSDRTLVGSLGPMCETLLSNTILDYSHSPDGMMVHLRVTQSIKFAGTLLYTWVRRDTVRVSHLVQEHKTMSQARVQDDFSSTRSFG